MLALGTRDKQSMAEKLTSTEANRRFYSEHARTYHETEDCVVHERLRRRLRASLVFALESLPAGPKVLDACGGSGNASLILHELGVAPTIVDVSPEMLSIYVETARARGYEVDAVVADIAGYLETHCAKWDLVIFSSALHHLDDYEQVLRFAIARLAPGGLLLTMFDPIEAGPFLRRARRLDYILHVVIHTPTRLPSIFMRYVARSVRRRAPGEDPALGEQAEIHALNGIDDDSLRRMFEDMGLEIVVHERTCEGRFRLTRGIYRLLRMPSSFHFVARRPPPARD